MNLATASTTLRQPAIEGTPGCVAVVDDDEQVSLALDTWLEMRGLCCQVHDSGESLLRALQPEACDAKPLLGAVLDLNLPGINGIELAYQLRRLQPSLPLAIITALHEDERAAYGELPPGIRCLKKPFELDALEEALFPPAV